MGIRTKYFPRGTGVNHEQIATMNTALVTELEIDAKPESIIPRKNRTCEFFIEKTKLEDLNPITCMGSLELNSNKLIL